MSQLNGNAGPGQGEAISRLSVCISDKCNNRCRYCGCGLTGKLALKEAVMAELARGRALNLAHVEFTGGEPTLHPSLAAFIASARALGYATIGISTNGRKLAYPAYAGELAAAGLNYAVLSVPAADKKNYTRITGAPGAAFVEALAGLKSAAGAGIETGALVPVTGENAGGLAGILRLLDGFGLSFLTLSRPLPGFPGGAHAGGQLDRAGFAAAVRKARKVFGRLRTRVLVEDFSGDLAFLPEENLIGELLGSRYLYADAVKKRQFLMPDAALAPERPRAGNFSAAIDLQYGPSDFTAGFDSRIIRGRQYHRLEGEKLAFDLGAPVLKKFLSVVNSSRTIDIWGRDRADRFPKLKELAGLCRKAGFRKIRLWTTGLALDSEAALDRLRALGVTALELPIYGATARTHDKITGRAGSFRTLSSVMARLACRRDFEVSFHSVALKANIPELPAICGAVNAIDKAWEFAVWNYYPDYQSAADKKSYAASLPSYDSLVAAFRAKPASGRAALVLFPRCVVNRLGRVFKGARFFSQAAAARLLVYRDGLFYFKNIVSAGEFGRKHAPPCRACKYGRACPGVFADYLDKYGYKSIG